MHLKGEYEQFWSEEEAEGDFFAYERNLVLPTVFVKTAQPKKVLDLGCGPGITSLFLEQQGFTVFGLDFSINALQKAKELDIKPLICGDSQVLPYKSKTFDMVFAGDLLEHLIDPDNTLAEINRTLKNDGTLIISVPNSGFYGARILYFLTGKIYNIESSGNPPWKWQHIRFYNKKIIKDLLGKFNFSVVKIYGVPDIKGKKRNFNLRMIPHSLVMFLMSLLKKPTFNKIVNLSGIMIVVARKT